MIEAQALSKHFLVRERTSGWALRPRTRRVQAVDAVSFRAEDGQITGLLGPNGAGKTTTLRMLATLLSPDSGDAVIDGARLSSQRARVRRQLGVLGDAKGLYWRLTARENIVYFGELHGLTREAAHKRADALLEELGLTSLADRPTQGFSQGERMKVAIARALVHDPRTILLDEPTNGLDIMATRAMRDLIRRLKAQGKCVLFSSHIMQEVAALCDRIVIIARGRVVFDGTPEETLARAGTASLEEAFVRLIGSEEGLSA
ncbi:MAG: ATP-binding cassette domain-containing protein [Casimicrobiaceae bacterium]|nr:ATP-binding cassette domain-containing protein [Casimicrobiaceae bacterium]MCX8098939.1 ATP-binding cassette domain-containing protein [Casimicrobiaceae bacterium]MDW8312638.1 ATP-binding cassette domain-containing protein [Burkholderiales bacterium]